MARVSLPTVVLAVFVALLLRFPALRPFWMLFAPFWLGLTAGAVFAPLLRVLSSR
ncbi:MAG: hypothetical protein KGN80_03675 [Acidobacteriota bacterium]|nr:hypothetical protein [Acidobacteriota bacterium]